MVQGLETFMKINFLIGREKEEDERATNCENKWKEVEGQGNSSADNAQLTMMASLSCLVK
jgi:hypothetical protein